MSRLFIMLLVPVFLAACQSNPPAPVVDKSPQTKKQTSANSANKTHNKDWRPNNYVVKKGDTLYSVSLAHGYYYKDIAAANNIDSPYPINVGQRLDFSSLNNKNTVTKATPLNTSNENGVVITPIDNDDVNSGQVISTVTPILSEPKATREPYSLAALNRKPATTKPVATKPSTAVVTVAKPTTPNTPTTPSTAAVSSTGWSWPTVGKITSRFNPISNKGIDIAGKKGQAIKAAAPGKVIYTGSDLRGYGKLVIIKHNKTFLSVYAHNSKIAIKEGQAVKAGQKIAEMGDSGTNTVKLHFEIRKQGKSIDPSQYLPQN